MLKWVTKCGFSSFCRKKASRLLDFSAFAENSLCNLRGSTACCENSRVFTCGVCCNDKWKSHLLFYCNRYLIDIVFCTLMYLRYKFYGYEYLSAQHCTDWTTRSTNFIVKLYKYYEWFHNSNKTKMHLFICRTGINIDEDV